MYKASLGFVGVAGVALLIGWLKQSNPATYIAIATAIVAFLLLIASSVLDRVRGRTDLATADGAEAPITPRWTPPPGEGSRPEPSAPYAGASAPAYSPGDSPTMSMPAPGEASGPDPIQSRFARFVRRAGGSQPAPEPAPEVTPALEVVPPLHASMDEDGYNDDVEPRWEPDAEYGGGASPDDASVQGASADDGGVADDLMPGPRADTPEELLARAQAEVEALLAQPIEPPRRPAPPRAPTPAPEAAPERPPASSAAGGAPHREQDEWLERVMRRREERAAELASPQPPVPERAPLSRSRVGPRVPAAPPAGVARAPGAGDTPEDEMIPWSARRRRMRSSAPAPDYELRATRAIAPEIPPGAEAEPEPQVPEPEPTLTPEPARTARRYARSTEPGAGLRPPAEPEAEEPAIAPWTPPPAPAPAPASAAARPPAATTTREHRPKSSFSSSGRTPAPKPEPEAETVAPAAPAPKPVAAKPVAAKPVAAKPVAKPAAAKVAPKPTTPKPAPAKPVATKPVATKPVAAKPVATKPVATKPAPAKPAVKPASSLAPKTTPKATAKVAAKPEPKVTAKPVVKPAPKASAKPAPKPVAQAAPSAPKPAPKPPAKSAPKTTSLPAPSAAPAETETPAAPRRKWPSVLG